MRNKQRKMRKEIAGKIYDLKAYEEGALLMRKGLKKGSMQKSYERLKEEFEQKHTSK